MHNLETNLSVSDKPDYDLGKSSIMKEAMYCVCGFSTQSGNKLAKHLGNHGCQSAYASLEEAEKARIMPEGQEDNVSVFSRDIKTGLQGEKEQGNNDDNDKNNDDCKPDCFFPTRRDRAMSALLTGVVRSSLIS